MSMLHRLWGFRGFISHSVKREFQQRYHNSLLGATWAVLGPLAQILVYTVIFSQIMRTKLPDVDTTFGYSIYLCVGLITWGYFAEIVTRFLNVFIDNANLIKKIQFPRLSLPLIAWLSATVNLLIMLGLFGLFLVLSGNFPGWPVLAAVPVLCIVVLFAFGLGISLGVVNVFFRDAGPGVAILLQFWFWLTPIVYPMDILPTWVHNYMQLNPLASLVGALHTIFVFGRWPAWSALWPAAMLSLLLCWFGLCLYRKHAGDMADQL